MPESTLKNNSNTITFHFVQEGSARDEWNTAYIKTYINVADMDTKPLPSGEKFVIFVSMILHYL